MELFPAVVIHGLDDARRALAPALPLVLLSAPGAAGYAGCGFWRELVIAARELPSGDCVRDDALDCGDAPGYALASFRIGQQTIVFDGCAPGFCAVEAAAAEVGATVLTARPPALDMRLRNADRRLLAWLRGDSGTPLG